MTKEKATTKKEATRRVKRSNTSWDICGFTKAINWDVLEQMDAKQLEEIAKILEKVK